MARKRVRHTENRPYYSDDLREELLRPNPYLGYRDNSLALYLIKQEAFAIAEKELRRAVWLNPFEPVFKAHLAWCLHREQKDDEAQEWLRQALEQGPNHPRVRLIRRWIENGPDPDDGLHRKLTGNFP